MIRSATPKHEFTIPLAPELIADIWVTYTQNDNIVLEKRKSNGDMSNEDNLWFYKLSQEDTKVFDGDYFVRIQAKVLTTGGDVIPSDRFTLTVEDVLNDEVMGFET